MAIDLVQNHPIKLSIVIPCLNEAETLALVINKAASSIIKLNIAGEIIVADNGSTDGSQLIAIRLGAKVVDVPIRGYGAAILEGIKAANGKYIIMADADDSYALDNIGPFLIKLEEGFDLVVGNRFKGGIEKGSMPWLHRFIGNPILSWLGRLFYKIPIWDFHCGMRGFNRKSILTLKLMSTGMEFASEMIVKASLNSLSITEVPTTLKKDGRSRPPHLRTWRDGWRHLIFLLAASPRWLFFYPGLGLLVFGFTGVFSTMFGEISVGSLRFDLNTFFLSIGLILVGSQTILMAILARVFSYHRGILPITTPLKNFQRHFTLNRGILLSLVFILLAILGLLILFIDWTGSNFDNISVALSLRISGLFLVCFCLGLQILFASFFAAMLQV